MPTDRRLPISLRIYRWIVGWSPEPFRSGYRDEAVGALRLLMAAERRRRGRAATGLLWMRSLIDLVAVVIRERRLSPGSRPGGAWNAFTDLSGDTRAALRAWRRTPGFSLTIILTLMVGLGLASAIFAFADGYLFRPLPFPDSDRLFRVRDPAGQIAQALNATDTLALRESHVGHLGFVEWGGTTPVTFVGDVMAGDRRVRVRVEGVSPGFAQTLRMSFEAGRPFTEEDHRGIEPVPAWVSYRVWQRDFGGDPRLLGRTLTISGPPTLPESRIVVVGIMDRRVTAFDLNNPPPELVVPALEPKNPGPNIISFPIVRLPEGMSEEQATAAIGAALQGIAPAPEGETRSVRLQSLYRTQTAGGRPTARVFFAGALLVLALVTINLVHLLLARGVARRGELATRAALGASRWRIARTFLVESLMLGAAGVAGGLALGAWLAAVIAANIPVYPTAGRNLSLVVMAFDGRTMAFAVCLGLLMCLFGGVWPAWQAVRRPVTAALRNAGGTRAAPLRLSRFILLSEVAVATVILAGAMFMGLGIWRYLYQPLGVEFEGRWSVFLTPPRDYSEEAEKRFDWSETLRVVRDLPRVNAASLASPDEIRQRGSAEASQDVPIVGRVASQFFEAWGMPPVAGRVLREDEIRDDAAVAVIDEKIARRGWPAGDMLGQTIEGADGRSRTVVGVVAHVRQRLTMEMPGVIYVPRPRIDRRERLVVWAPGLSADALEEHVSAALAPLLPGYRASVRPYTFEDRFARDAGEALFQQPIVAVFGIATFVLTGIGLFGLIVYLVDWRRRDFGVRLALGARPRDIWRAVVGDAVTPSLGGIALGLGAAWALESVARSTVFGWESSGPLAMSAVATALLGVAVLAAAVPARRAMRIDPAIALRAE